MNTEVIAKSSGKIAVVDSGDLALDQPSIVKIKIGPETVERFEQVGNDLLIVLKDGSALTIRGFFVQDDEGHRSDLVLEDVEGVHWWGQYTSPWSDFHFAEIQEDVAAAGFIPPAAGLPGWAIAALGLVGAGAIYAAIDDGDSDKHSNRPPESPNYAHTVAENDPVSGRVAGVDADGDALTYAVTKQPTNGTVTINPQTGAYTYTPKPGYNGQDTFVVTVTDGKGGSSTSTISIDVTPVNDLPVPVDPNEGLQPGDPGYISGQSFDPESGDYEITTPEDTAIAGKVTGTDADGDQLTYVVGEPPSNGTVTIDPETGEYSYVPNPDYNGPDEFTVIIDDGQGGTTTSKVIITVVPENDPPAFEDPNQGGTPPGPNQPGTIFTPPGTDGAGNPTPASYTVSYNENTAAGVELGQVQAGDVDGDNVTFAISAGNDNGWYAIDPTTGVITLTPAGAASLANDYESTGNSHQITVVASDGNGGTTTITVTLNELDVNEVPEFEDPNQGGTPPGPNQPGTIFTPPGTDGAGNPTPASYTVSYNENTAAGVELGQVQAGDVDGDNVTFAISAGNDNGWYAIDPTTGVITLTPAGAASLANDYESTGNSHQITVVASDGNGGTTTITVTLNELDVNEVPEFEDPNQGGTPPGPNQPGTIFTPPGTDGAGNPTPASYTVSYNENTAAGVELGQVQAGDVDGDNVTFAISAGNDNGWYAIDPTTGVITLTPAGAASLANDYESTGNSHQITVVASDGNGGTTTITVTLNELDVNEVPEFEDPNQGGTPPGPNQPGTIFTPPGTDGAGNPTPASYTVSYNENTAAGVELGQVQAGDVDGDNVTFAISAGNDNGWYAIDPTTGVITLTPAGAASLANDYESTGNSHQITVVASDGNGGTTTITVTLNELDVNEVPEFEDPNQGGTPPGPNQPGTIFTPPGTDGAGNPTPASYTVSYNENTAAGVELGQVQAGDVDGDNVTFAISAGNDNGWYAIDPTTGVITLTPAGAASLANDYESTGNSHQITVVASDGNGGTTTITVTLNELDVNEVPEFEDPNQGGTPPGPNQPGTIFTPPGTDGAGNPTPASYTVSYNENTAAGVELGQVQAGDVDGDNVTFAISAGNDNGWYAIDPTTGVITLTPAGAASLANDYESTGNSHQITVVASDGNGGTTTITVTLNELDLDDSSPVIIDAQAAVYEEGLPGGFPDGNDSPTIATGQVDINDPDTVGGPLTVTLVGPVGLTSGGEVVTWSGTGSVGDPLIGTAGGEEVINATIDNEGNYTVTLLKPLDHSGSEDQALDIGLTVTADDGVNPPATGTLTVTVHDDAPVANPGSVDVVLPEQDTNVMLILDISSSMTASRVAGMKAAVTELLDTYAGLGNVAVQIVVFGTAAGTQAWGTSWGDIDAAKAYVNGINANSPGTNYDAALLKAMDAFDDPGKIAGGKNVSYFLTDGEPNQNSNWGIPGSAGNGINNAEEAAWKDFLEANQILSQVFGMEVPTGQQANARGNMDRIAYDGINNEDTDSVFVNDIDDLPPILRDSAIDASQGAVVDMDGTLGGNSGLGADGGGLLDITVNGRTYHDDGSVTGGAANGLFDAATNTWNILTEGPNGSVNTGGRLIVNMETGEYSYTPPIIDSGTRVEDIGFTLIDNDGDTASSTLTITVHPVGTVLPNSADGVTSFAFHGDEGMAGATGEQAHALPALSDLVVSYGSGSLDASLPGGDMQTFSGPLTPVAMPLPLVHPLDELDQHHQAMV